MSMLRFSSQGRRNCSNFAKMPTCSPFNPLSHVIRHIPPERLKTTCRIGFAEAVTLGVLIEDYLVHLRSHAQQLGF